MSFSPSGEDADRRDEVVAALLEAIRNGETVKLPPFDPRLSQPEEHAALLAIGSEPNPYGGHVDVYRYQLEGEDDLLHLIVSRIDGTEIDMAEAQHVASFLWPQVPSGLVWAKPGTLSHHFYIGHDVLLEARA